MSIKYHPLVQKTKAALERLDKLKNVSWEEKRKFYSEYLPVTFEPKLRSRALNFMDKLIKKLEENNHSIKFDYQRCHVEMYGELLEINLRHKYFKKQIKEADGYLSTIQEPSYKLEFQTGSCYRKGWLEKEKLSIEEYLPAIYDYIEKDCRFWAEVSNEQKIKAEKEEAQKKIDEEIVKQKSIEKEKFQKLVTDSENYYQTQKIRSYLAAYESKLVDSNITKPESEEYLEWAKSKIDEIDPLGHL